MLAEDDLAKAFLQFLVSFKVRRFSSSNLCLVLEKRFMGSQSDDG